MFNQGNRIEVPWLALKRIIKHRTHYLNNKYVVII